MTPIPRPTAHWGFLVLVLALSSALLATYSFDWPRSRLAGGASSGSLDELMPFVNPDEAACVVVGGEPTTVWLRVMVVPGSEELHRYSFSGMDVAVNPEASGRISEPVQEVAVRGEGPAVWSDRPSNDSALVVDAERLAVNPSSSRGTYLSLGLLVEGSGAQRGAIPQEADLTVRSVSYRSPGSGIEQRLDLERRFWLVADDEALDECDP